MDAEGLYFASLLHRGEVAAFRGVPRDHFTAAYQPVYDYVLRFVREQRKLPRFETVAGRFPDTLPGQSYEDPTFYAEEVRKNAMRVALEKGFTERVVGPLSETQSTQALSELKDVVSEVSRQFQVGDASTYLGDIRDTVQERMADYQLRKLAAGTIGIPTPWPSLTRATGGLQGGDACAILARPNKGKTFAMAVWATYLWQTKHRVLFASMETPPQAVRKRTPQHRVIGGMCRFCYAREVSESEVCYAAAIPRQRLTTRFDALGARLSAWRLYKGWLTPQEERKLERYYAACATGNQGKWGELRIVANPYITSVADLEMACTEFQPDVVFWDSAYIAASRRGRRTEAASVLVQDFVAMLERCGIPGIVSWHFNREVTEKATDAGMGCAALTDELPRLFDLLLGLFRPPDVEDAGEAIWQTLKTRDGLKMPEMRTYFQVKDHIDFSEIQVGG